MSKVAFTEKLRQCQQVLLRDFPNACVFKDQYDVLPLERKAALTAADNGEEANNIVRQSTLRNRVPCLRHGGMCHVTRTDLSIFGAPCTDDSSAGNQEQQEGPSRRVSELTFQCLPFSPL